MKKMSLLSISLAALSFVSVWAQDAPKQSRNLSFYMDASSGQLAPGTHTANKKADAVETGRDQAFEGSEMEWGIRYSQNFKAVPWLSMGGAMVFVMNFAPVYDANSGKYVGSGNNALASLNNIKANFWISMPHFMLLIDARGLMGVYANYGFSFGKGGSLTLGADLEYFYTGNAWYGNGHGNVSGPIRPGYVVDLFAPWISYGVGLGKGFSFGTALQFRMCSNYWNNWVGVEEDPTGSFELRWNTTFSYGIDNWNLYLQFRLSGYGLAGSSSKANTKDPAAVFQLISGISYTFDLANK